MSLIRKNSLINNNYINEKIFKIDDINLILNNRLLFNKPCVEIKGVFYTPLQASIIYQSSKIRDFLLKQKTINVNAQNSKGENTLITAILSKSSTSVIKELFKRNVEICIPKDSNKTSILDYADPSWEGYSELNHMIQRKKSYQLNYKKQNSIRMSELKLNKKKDDVVESDKIQECSFNNKEENKEKEHFNSLTSDISESFELDYNKIDRNMSQIPIEIDQFQKKLKKKKSISNESLKSELSKINNSNSSLEETFLEKNYFTDTDNVKSESTISNLQTYIKKDTEIDKIHCYSKVSKENFIESSASDETESQIVYSKQNLNNCDQGIKKDSSQLFNKNQVKNQNQFQNKTNEKYDFLKDSGLEDDYLLLIDHQITESIEMSKYFFSCSFCTNSRPWKSESDKEENYF